MTLFSVMHSSINVYYSNQMLCHCATVSVYFNMHRLSNEFQPWFLALQNCKLVPGMYLSTHPLVQTILLSARTSFKKNLFLLTSMILLNYYIHMSIQDRAGIFFVRTSKISHLSTSLQ